MLLSLVLVSVNAAAKKIDPPNIQLEQALVLAKEHLKTEKVSLEKGYVLLKAEYLNLYNEYGVAHWLFRWEHVPKVKGAWIEVRLDNQNQAKIYYGE